MIEPKKYKNISGIYILIQPDGRYYIGSSSNIYNRLRQHKYYQHSNKTKKSAWKFSCDFDELEIKVIKYEVDRKELFEIEEFYIQMLVSDEIINTEFKTFGRNISGDNNPVHLIKKEQHPFWKGGILQQKITCICGCKKSFYSKLCKKCYFNKK